MAGTLADRLRTGLEPGDFTLQPTGNGSGICPTSVIRVQRADGTAYQYTDTNEDGVPEVEAIPAFYDTDSDDGDTEPPTAPSGLVATAVSSAQIDLVWDASTDNVGVTGYRVYRDGAPVATVSGTSYSDTGLEPDTTYSYAISALDAAGNESDRSKTVSATTDPEPPSPFPTSGLVAHWKFDEGSGDVAGDSAGSNNGAIVGATWVAGHVGSNALSFDGVDDRIELGAIDIPGSALTIAAWVNADNLSGDWRIISKATGTATDEHWWMISLRNGKLRLRLKIEGTTRTLGGSNGPSVGTWHHVAATYDGSTMRLYLDGIEVKSRSRWSGALDSNPNVPASIGGNPDGSNFWPGRIDDVRVYDRALSASEVAGLHGGT